jgi:hypothetical protein
MWYAQVSLMFSWIEFNLIEQYNVFYETEKIIE